MRRAAAVGVAGIGVGIGAGPQAVRVVRNNAKVPIRRLI